jgi:hypothetical protein
MLLPWLGRELYAHQAFIVDDLNSDLGRLPGDFQPLG